MAAFISLLLPRDLVSSRHFRSRSAFFSSFPQPSPSPLTLLLPRADVVSSLIIRCSATPHFSSRHFQSGCLFFFSFFTICYLESYMCSYTLFYNFQFLVFLLLFSEFYLAFCSFSFSVLISLHIVVDSTGTSLTLLVHIAIYEVGIIF
jgi:hypothetical protein